MTKNWRGLLFAAVYILLALAALVLVLIFGRPRVEPARKVGFIMTASSEEEQGAVHYNGVREACETLGVELLLRDGVPEATGACPQAVAELAAEGAEMIILSSSGYAFEMEPLLAGYPEVSFYGMFATQSADNLTGYSARMYQAQYLSGIVAGLHTKSNVLGFVAADDSSESCRCINAFALGARRVNPEAEVVVVWTGRPEDAQKEMDATYDLIYQEQADVVTYHQDQHAVIRAAEAAGVASIGYYNALEGVSDNYLTCAACDWDLLYQELIREYLRSQSSALLNNWLGLESGAVGLTAYSPLVSQEARDEVEKAKQDILSGLDVFTNEIYDNQGRLRCGPGEAIGDDTLRTRIDWLVRGVRVYE